MVYDASVGVDMEAMLQKSASISAVVELVGEEW